MSKIVMLVMLAVIAIATIVEVNLPSAKANASACAGRLCGAD